MAFYISNFNEVGMKKYSIWIGLMAGATFFFLALATVIGRYFFIMPVYNPALFKLEQSTNTLIIGASHSATSFDTNYFKDSLSVASSGEPLFFTYYKTKALLENNPQIKNIIVAISPIHIGPYSERNLFLNDSGSRKFAMNYYFLIDDINDPIIKKISSDNIISYLKFHWGIPFNYMSDLRPVFNYYTNRIKYTDYVFFGGVERVRGNHIEHDRIKKKAKYYFYDKANQSKPNEIGIENIHRIASLTKQFDVKLIIVSTPLHPYFIKQIPEEIQESYDRTIEDIQDQNKNITFIDLSHHFLDDNKYLDGDHLNLEGEIAFSQFFMKEYLTMQPYKTNLLR